MARWTRTKTVSNPKIKTISMDSEMERLGIDPLKIEGSKTVQKHKPSATAINNSFINNRQCLSKQAWIRLLTVMDMRQWCSILLWENVPNKIPSWLINQMAYYHGGLAGFNYQGGFYILPYSMKGGLNCYGLPTKITPISYNGEINNNTQAFSTDFNCVLNIGGNYNENANTVLYYSGMPLWSSGVPIPTASINKSVIEQMAEILARINIQITVTNKKIILKCDDAKQQASIIKQLESAFNTDSPYVVLSDTSLQTIELQPSNNVNASDFWIHFEAFNSLKNTSNGVDNSGFFKKKEREITEDGQGNDTSTSLCLTDRLYFAKEFVNMCKEQFGDPSKPNYIVGMEKFSVRFNEEIEVVEGIDGKIEKENTKESDKDVTMPGNT